MKKRVLFIAIICLACTLSIWANGAQQGQSGGATWPPVRNIEMVCPSGAASGTDAVGRVMAAYLTKKVGANFFMTNDNAGGGTVAYEKIRNGPTDGSTFMFTTTNMILQHYAGIYQNNVTDFTVITDFRVPVEQSMFVVRADAKWNTFEEFIADARANPNKITIGCGSMGSVYARVVAMEQVFGVTFRKVDGQDNAERISGILGGYTDWVLLGAVAADPYVKNGDFKYLAYYWNERAESRPDVPCVKEFGYTVPYWDPWEGHYLILGPKGMNETVADAIANAINGLEEDPTSRETLWNIERGYPVRTTRQEAIPLVQQIDTAAKEAMGKK